MNTRFLTYAATVAILSGLACDASSNLGRGLAGSSICGGECRIALDTVAVIGADTGSVSPRESAAVIQMSDGRFLVAPTDHPGVLAIYGTDGRLVNVFGGAGEGPGEYDLEFMRFHRGQHDSISVIDAFRLRRTVVDNAGRLIRMHSLPAAHTGYFEMSRKAYFQADIRGSDGKTRLFHELTGDGSIARSFVELSSGNTMADPYRARAETDSGLWLARRTEYVAEFYDTSFQIVRTVRPKAKWFTPHHGEFASPRTERPQPMVLALSSDSKGMLWFLIRIADERWKPTETKGEVRPTVASTASMFDFLVEVVDPVTGRRLANARWDFPVLLSNGDRLIYVLSTGRFGQGVLTAVRAHLVPQ